MTAGANIDRTEPVISVPSDRGGLSEPLGDPDEVLTARTSFYVELLTVEWGSLTPRQRRRLHRRHPMLEIALRHLVDEGLIHQSTRASLRLPQPASDPST